MSKGIPAAIVAFLIGTIAAYIAWRQYQTAKAKLKLDLFERRYVIFQATWELLSKTVWTGTVDTSLPPINNLIPQARFLFGSNIEEYLKEISSKWTEAWVIRSRALQHGNVIQPEDGDRNAELEKWFYDQASGEAKKKFAPYLNFEAWT